MALDVDHAIKLASQQQRLHSGRCWLTAARRRTDVVGRPLSSPLLPATLLEPRRKKENAVHFGHNKHDPVIQPEQERATEAFLAREYEQRQARELAALDRWWQANPHHDKDYVDAA